MKNAALLAVVLSGCSVGQTVHVDRRFTPEEQRLIAEAAEGWRLASGGTVEVDLAFGEDVSIWDEGRRVLVRATSADDLSRFPALASPNEAGYDHVDHDLLSGPTGEVMVLVPDRVPPWVPFDVGFRDTAAHEIGHHLGLQHVADERATMYRTKTVGSSHCVGPADLEELCRAVGCGPEPMPGYCFTDTDRRP